MSIFGNILGMGARRFVRGLWVLVFSDGARRWDDNGAWDDLRIWED